ncbi:class I SAM-dependent methyltransferase [Alicyclobacillus cellulosilyticus]|uniref:class I SAM-dependent methyltransferase n=1 Tax=Alicyclobacillus cellulosilyticus TaxID=1003997 RepID=UPI001E3388DB|nr:class I SAM-dependent methyltransferase [Alicyclobacillus cellulosilyticus]
MPIDFLDPGNRNTYAGREAHPSWRNAMLSLVDARGFRVADIGCGGGIYARAWLELGASTVIGVDSSPVMLEAAREHAGSDPRLSFVSGDAATRLADNSMDLAFARALIHHLSDIRPFIFEAHRILAPGGRLVIQDRTPDDVDLPGSTAHIRGYFFERFPRLLEIERSRRWTKEQVATAMRQAGFTGVATVTFWEIRRIYQSSAELTADLRARTGRSILHHLADDELEDLISFIGRKLSGTGRSPIAEADRWTVWCGRKRAAQGECG